MLLYYLIQTYLYFICNDFVNSGFLICLRSFLTIITLMLMKTAFFSPACMILIMKRFLEFGELVASTEIHQRVKDFVLKYQSFTDSLLADGYFKTNITTVAAELEAWFAENGMQLPVTDQGRDAIYIGSIFKMLDSWIADYKGQQSTIEIAGQDFIAAEFKKFGYFPVPGKQVFMLQPTAKDYYTLILETPKEWIGLDPVALGLEVQDFVEQFNQSNPDPVNANFHLRVPCLYTLGQVTQDLTTELGGMCAGGYRIMEAKTGDKFLLNQDGFKIESAMFIAAAKGIDIQPKIVDIQHPTVITLKINEGTHTAFVCHVVRAGEDLFVQAGTEKAVAYMTAVEEAGF
jgi:hypothetical protein